jgi:hypothetical protein
MRDDRLRLGQVVGGGLLGEEPAGVDARRWDMLDILVQPAPLRFGLRTTRQRPPRSRSFKPGR